MTVANRPKNHWRLEVHLTFRAARSHSHYRLTSDFRIFIPFALCSGSARASSPPPSEEQRTSAGSCVDWFRLRPPRVDWLLLGSPAVLPATAAVNLHKG